MKNRDVLTFLEELYVPKREFDSYSELVRVVANDLEVDEPSLDMENVPNLKAIRIITKGKGGRETFKGFEKIRVCVLKVRDRYSFIYDGGTKLFARMDNKSPRLFLYSEVNHVR